MKKNILLFGFVVCGIGTVNTYQVNAQIINTYAGGGATLGDGSAATAAQLNNCYHICRDAGGNLYIADRSNNRIRKVDAGTGIITTVAGNGTMGFLGDGSPATAAEMNRPTGVAVDAAGNIYIADQNNNRIRKVDVAGIINTIAGIAGPPGSAGDFGPATAAQLNAPIDVAVDPAGTNVYISDNGNNKIRVINTATGIIATAVGTGAGGPPLGDGGPALAAHISGPDGIFLDASGNLFIADVNNNRIREVNATTLNINTVAGSGGPPGFGGDGTAATTARLNGPRGVSVDGSGNIYIADAGNNRIRYVNTTGMISTIAGTGTPGFFGDGGAPLSARINNPEDVLVFGTGNYYISDRGNNRIRWVNNDVAPTFIGGATQALTVCENSGANDINALLAITDPDVGQTETWSVATAATHGTLAISFTATSTGTTITPTGLTYTPAVGYSGVDNFVISINDGFATTTTTVNVTVSPLPAVSPIVGVGQICTASPVTFTDPTPSGVWSATTGNAAVTSGGLVTGITAGTDNINYSVTNSCGTMTVNYPVTVNVTVVPSVTVSSTYGTVTCPGVTDVFTAVGVNGGTSPTYQWFVNSATVGTGLSYSYIPAPFDVVKCIMTSTATCASTPVVSDFITMDGGSAPVPAISITSSAGDTSCVGAAVTYSAATINGGPTPGYVWTVNGVPTGSASTFTYTPTDGDVVVCTLTSSIPCAAPSIAVSNTIAMSVHVVVTPAVSVTAAPGSTVCIGTSTTYTASAISGGGSPDFTWTKNGINVATGPTYTYTPANGDHIYCTMHSSALCATSSTVLSSTINMNVIPPVAPTVTIVSLHGTHISVGQYDTLVAVVTGTTSFPTYQWFVNGVSVAGATHSNFVYTGADAGTALITCIAGSGDACNTTGTSNLVTLSISPVGVRQVWANDGELTVAPNPSKGAFSMNLSSGYEESVLVTLTNVVGEKVQELHTGTNTQTEIQMNQPAGIYILTATTDHGKYVAKVMVE